MTTRTEPGERPSGWLIGFVLLVTLVVSALAARSGDHDPNQQRRDPTALATGLEQPVATFIPVPALASPPSLPVGARAARSPFPTAAPNPLAAAIDQLLAGEDGVYGVVVLDPERRITYSRNAETPFIAASLYKLILLADIYRRRELGELSFETEIELLPTYFPGPSEPPDSYFTSYVPGGSTTVGVAVFATGAYSSNVAARALLSLTDAASLEATAQELGLNDTHFFVDPATLPSWPPPAPPETSPAEIERAATFIAAEAADGPVNLTTPRDMATFFALLLDGAVVSPEASAEMLDILKEQAVDDRFPVLLPYPTELAHKTGNLDHVVHDVGVIFTPDGPVILAAMVEDAPDDLRATWIIQRLARIAYGFDDVPPLTDGSASGLEDRRPEADDDIANPES